MNFLESTFWVVFGGVVATVSGAYSSTGNNIPQLHYDGLVAGQHIVLKEQRFSDKSVLELKLPDGRRVEYVAQEVPCYALRPTGVNFKGDFSAEERSKYLGNVEADLERLVGGVADAKGVRRSSECK